MYIAHILLLSLIVIYSSSYNEYHQRHRRKVDDTIKRYSREVNLEVNEIKNKFFERKIAREDSLKIVSESTRFKYGILMFYCFRLFSIQSVILILQLDLLILIFFINMADLWLSVLDFACHYKLVMRFAG